MPAIGHAQRLAVIALAVARFALDPHVRQKVHLNALLAVPLAIVAAAPRPIEAEAGRLISANARFGQPGEQFPDRVEHAGVGRRVRSGRVPQRLLVDADHLVDQIEPANLGVRPRWIGGAIQFLGNGPRQRVLDQGTLPRTGDTRDAGERPQRQTQIDVAQVVLPRAQEFDPTAAGGIVGSAGFHAPRFGNRDLFAARKILSRERGRRPRDFFRRSRGGNRPAEPPGPRTEVEESVSGREDFAVMLDENDSISQIPQSPKHFQQPIVVAGMQADRRLIEDVQDARQSAADLPGKPDSLCLTARKGRQRAGQSQIVESDVDQKGESAGRFVQQVARDLAIGR